MIVVDLVRMVRPLNIFMISAMTVAGVWFGNSDEGLLSYLLALFVAVTYSSIAMIHNDIIDLEIDQINAPHRAIAAGRVTKRQATVYSVALFIVGTTAGLSLLNVPCILIMFTSLVLSLAYNARLKKTGIAGNIIVGFTATSSFIYGDAVSAEWAHLWPADAWNASVYLFLISAILNTSREVCKGIMDTEGDNKYGVKTIAVVYGKSVAARLVIVLVFGALSLGLVSVFVTSVFGYIFIIMILSFVILILIVGIPLVKNPTYENAKQFKLWIHPIMLFALIMVIIDKLYA
ncbi:MAG: geranylgeranylglycerol-phosphate geranylgeranyltransferase [Candidatus Kariarchaeaceae archaeon]